MPYSGGKRARDEGEKSWVSGARAATNRHSNIARDIFFFYFYIRAIYKYIYATRLRRFSPPSSGQGVGKRRSLSIRYTPTGRDKCLCLFPASSSSYSTTTTTTTILVYASFLASCAHTCTHVHTLYSELFRVAARL